MIFVDTNVFMYAVGREHPLREKARAFLRGALEDRSHTFCTSAEICQELLHAYIPVRRMEALGAALLLARGICAVWPLEAGDVILARFLADQHPELGARDLTHIACCIRRGVKQIRTFDRNLAAVFPRIVDQS